MIQSLQWRNANGTAFLREDEGAVPSFLTDPMQDHPLSDVHHRRKRGLGEHCHHCGKRQSERHYSSHSCPSSRGSIVEEEIGNIEKNYRPPAQAPAV